MSQTIYRKYRPRKFEELVGQDHVKITLQNELNGGRIAQAFLFTGPRGVGKTTTARLLSKAVNCEEGKKKDEPCNQCPACREINEGRALDILEIDAASHTQVDHVRESIIPNARTSPTRLKYKIFIIDEVHMLSISAFNALLKILEEPPAHVIFILATTEVHKLPETIISRCQRFDFKRVSASEIKERLKYICRQEKIEVEESVLQIIAVMAEGSLRDAESTLGQIFSLGVDKITRETADLVLPRSDFKLIFSLFENLAARKAKESIEIVNNLVNEGVNIKHFVDQFIEFLRKSILIKIDRSLAVFSCFEVDPENEKRYTALLSQTQLGDLKEMAEIFLKYRRELDWAPIPQLPLEMLIVERIGKDSESEKNDPVEFIPPSAKQEEKETKEKSASGRSPKGREAKEKPAPSDKAVNSGLVAKTISQWPEIIRQINKDNHSLALVLKSCLPFRQEDNFLIIGCKFSFHREKMSEMKNIAIIEEIIKKTLKQDIKIKFRLEDIVFPSGKEKNQTDQKEMADLLESFGGEVL